LDHSISVLGAGSWGTALAILIARNGHRVTLWGHNAEHQAALKAARCNERYLPGVRFPENVTVTADIASAVKNAEILLIVVPSHAFRTLLRTVSSHLESNTRVAWGTKGLDGISGQFFHDVATEVLSERFPTAVFSGPTFAVEVAAGLPTAITIASNQTEFAELLAAILHNMHFRAYTSTDMIGVQLAGAVKNILAIATGIADALNFGGNARAALITRGLAEMMRFGLALGGKAETFMGLAGVGDLILTCTGEQSRNRRLGVRLGQGKSLREAVAEIDQEIEGVATAKVVHQLSTTKGIEMPITEQVYKILYENLPPWQAVNNLLLREPKPESVIRSKAERNTDSPDRFHDRA
jgi:glycerol-3-phosphate dehydrogenase (NAD(P)+)